MRKTRIVFAILVVLAVALGSLALAARGGGGKLCRWSKIQCLDVWDPVTCDNGVTYSNACYARRACATGCTGGGAQQ